MLAIAISAGIVIGISLGALGGGGSILTVPVLVYALAQPPQSATTASLIIVGITSITAAIGHARAGHVQWKAAATFGLLGVTASLGGSIANRAINPQLLLLAFAALMLLAAAAMINRSRRPAGEQPSDLVNAEHPPDPVTAEHPARATTDDSYPAAVAAQAMTAGHRVEPASNASHLPHQAPVTPDPEAAPIPDEPPGPATQRHTRRAARIARVVTTALIVGFLTGFLGVGGGFLIVPALVLAMGFTMPAAVGTSLVIISITSLGAFTERLGTAPIPWEVVIPFTIAAIAGSLGGQRIADRVSGPGLTRAFAALLILVAGYVSLRAGTAL